MNGITRLKEKLPKYIHNTRQARNEERIVMYYCELIKDVFPKIGPKGLIPFIGRRVRVYGEDGKSSSKEADLLWDDVLIEFESSLSKTKIDESKRQLREYVSGCLNKNRDKEYKLISSDGVVFQRYVYIYPSKKEIITPADIRLEPAGRLDLESRTWNREKIGYAGLFQTILDYLVPEKTDFVPMENAYELFVPKSELYNKCMRILKDADHLHYATQFAEWKKYQNLVYGNFIKSQTDEAIEKQYDIFLNHTYMATIAKVLAYTTIYHDSTVTLDEKESILSGKAFNKVHIYNFITEDFFSWIIRDKNIWKNIMDMIFNELKRFDAKNIDRDILRSIYETIEEPEKRHELGAVYTPEWLAEMILNELFEQHHKSEKNIPKILDPACGSGTFLALAIRKILREYKSDNSEDLLGIILKSVVGFDLHPVAVLFSKTNYLIALKDLIRNRRGAISIPIYMADTIDFPEPKSASEQMNTTDYGSVNVYAYSAYEDQDLILPKDVIESNELDMIIDAIQRYAKRISEDGSKIEIHLEGLRKNLAKYKFDSSYQIIICDTAKTLACLIEQNKDTIHAFIFKNIYKPAVVGNFDIIAGNPPWVVYQNISDESRQDRLKKSTGNYGLLVGQQTFQAMELATLFFVKCIDRFLKKGGVIGFVMPRSILQSSQHHKFRLWEQNGRVPIQYSMIYDMGSCKKVKNLFTMESCVLFGKKRNAKRNNRIISYQFGGSPKKNSTLDDIEALMKKKKFYKKKAMMYLHEYPDLSTITTISKLFVRKSIYEKEFSQGASIFPHSLWLVKRIVNEIGASEDYPLLETIVGSRAKKPWDDIKMKKAISRKYLFSTIYGRSIMPFYFTNSSLIVVPAIARKRSYKMMTSDDLMAAGDTDMSEWVDEAERYWKERRAPKSPKTALRRLNYQKILTSQDPSKNTILLYNTSSGKYIMSCLVDVSKLVDSEKTSGYIVESSTYYYYPTTIDEGKYLCTILNSLYLAECISAIKAARHVHKTPWKFSIPRFDSNNANHKSLVRMYDECHAKLKGTQDTKRSTALKRISEEMPIIDELVEKIIMEEYQKSDSIKGSVLGDESNNK